MEYRTIDPCELTSFVHAIANAFGDPVPGEDDLAHDLGTLEPDRCFVAVDGGQIVGCTGVYSLRTIVPGGAVVPTAGVTTVGVLPTHRRRGVMTELMTRAFTRAAERGEPLSTLFAAEGAIYAKLGYAPATWGWIFDVDASRSAFHAYEPHGRSRLLPHTDVVSPFTDVYRRAMVNRPGARVMTEDDIRWYVFEREPEKPKHFYVVHESDDGTPDAVAVYRTKHRWPGSMPHVELKARHIFATTPQAWADIWRYLLDVDLVSHVTTLNERAPDDPLHWLLQEPRASRAKVQDGMYARPLDLTAALMTRGYARDGRTVIAVHDGFLPANDGTYEISVQDGQAAVVRTSVAPEIECDVRAIGATYLGGGTWHELARAGLVREHRDGALRTADAMFVTDLAPWAPLDF